jgi:hypothetical protein
MSPEMITAVKARDRFDAIELGQRRAGGVRAIAQCMLGGWNKAKSLIKGWWRR